MERRSPHLVPQGDGYKPAQKFLAFRVERMGSSVAFDAPADAPMAMPLEIDDLDVTTYTVNFGVGGDK